MAAYKLNGKDLKEIFGVVISNGSDTFLAFPERKDSLENNWPDEDGIEVDLNDPTFQAREFRLNCALVASGRVDFKTKYYALFTELKRSGTHTLLIQDLDQEYEVFYKKQENITKLTQIDRDKVAVKFDLIFREVTDSIPAVYLVDEQGRFLTI